MPFRYVSHAELLEDGDMKNFYFFIQPTIFEKGFTLEINGYDKDGNEIHFTKTSAAKLEAKVATIHRFALVNVNAELEAIQATYGWTTGFENMNGKEILPVTYNVTSHPSAIQWNFTFVDDATLAQPKYQFELQVTTDSEGTPALDMLTNDNISGYKVRLIDNAQGLEFTDSADNDGELKISRNADGSWKIRIDGLSVKDVSNEDNGSFFDFEFNGSLTLTISE